MFLDTFSDRSSGARQTAGGFASKPERSIGAVYHSKTPEAERAARYFTARLAEQFGAVLYVDEMRAVEPLERTRGETSEEAP
ncbi:MAG: hypothetical protein ACREXW_17140 [Gammaproteobacteria bacterium]